MKMKLDPMDTMITEGVFSEFEVLAESMRYLARMKAIENRISILKELHGLDGNYLPSKKYEEHLTMLMEEMKRL